MTCFTVRKGYRGCGVPCALADATIAHAGEHGARALEAYPIRTQPGKEITWGEVHVGSRSVFEDAGSVEVSAPTVSRSSCASTSDWIARVTVEDLPLIDEQRMVSTASADIVWRHLLGRLARTDSAPARAYVRAIGGQPRRASGRLWEEGATLPGFLVAEADPGRLLCLTGGHLFSRYAWTFTLDPTPSGGTTLTATTRAQFPGLRGRLYRAAVIGTGGHRAVVRRLLRAVARAETAG